MKKKLFSLIAALSCFACLGGCLKDNSGNKDSTPTTSEAPSTGDYNLESAKAIVKAMYFTDAYVNNNVDYEYPTSIPIGGVTYTIQWSVDVTEGVVVEDKGATALINVDEAAATAINYVLTAKIFAPDGTSIEQKFERTVKAVSQYVTATITGKPAENTAYKYHVYQSTLKQDMYFAGEMDGYYFKTTDDIEAAVELYVEHIADSENFYVYFTDAAGVKQYIGVRLSDDGAHNNIVYDTTPVSEFYWSETYGTIITTIPVDKDGNANTEFYLGNYASHKTISASTVSYFGGSGNNTGHLVGLVDRTQVSDADKVTASVNALILDASYQGGASYDLPERGDMYPEAVISWACDNELVAINGNSMTLNSVNDATQVTLVATISCGEATQTKEFTITITSALPADGSTLTIPQALEIGANLTSQTTQKYYVSGTITGFYTNGTTYGNVYIQDANGNEILIYGIYSEDGSVRYDAMENKPVEGDFIKVYGVLTSYNGTAQFKNTWLMEHTAGGGEEGGETPSPEVPPVVENEVLFNLTVDSLSAPAAYSTENTTVSVNGVDFTYVQVANYGNGLQWRTKEGVSASLWNSTAMGTITKIVLIPNQTKMGDYSNEYTLALGNTADCNEKTMNVATNGKNTVTITIEGSYTYFKLTHANTYTQYFDAIEVYCGEIEGGETPSPEVPPVEHEHNFVEGKCECGEEDPNYVPPVEEVVPGVVPEAGKPYIFGMTQKNVNNTVYYLAGGMSGYYMATTTDASAAIATYIEATEGGYYFYTYVDGAKTYINMVVSGTHVNGAYEATASTVYTIDEAHHTLIAIVNDAEYWFATRNDNTYTTMGPCAVSFAGFYGVFYETEIGGEEGGETPSPEVPPVEHEHNFVEGKCECGAEDPNYVAPEVHEHNFVEGKCECGEEDPNYVAPKEEITTIAGALAGAEGDKATFTGTVSEIYQAWNTQYSNMSFYVTDGTNRILVFRAGTLVGIGDEVSVSGTVTVYNEVNQIAQGSTVTITAAHVCSTFTDADCNNAATCTVCGLANGEALGHIDEDSNGTCDRCPAEMGVATITASKTIAELIVSEGWTSSTTKQEFNLDDVVSVKVNGGSNSGKAYNGDHIRIYATDSPAGTLTISLAEGYELVSVKVTTQTGTYAYLCVDGTTTDICNTTTNVSGSSVVLNSVKNGSDGKQVRVTAIEVVYKAV